MTITGIIAEYNPLHCGHAYLMDQLRRNGASHIAVVMSGNFVQRGEAAVFSKWARAKQALLCGADLVVELPGPWAVAGAERFALGGVSLLKALGADRIGFGSECGSVELLRQAADALSSPRLYEEMHKELAGGASFASARQSACSRLFGAGTASLLSAPNNILGIEYLKAVKRMDAGMTPETVARIGSAHDSSSPSGRTASSSWIRRRLLAGGSIEGYVPAQAYAVMKSEAENGRAPADLSRLEPAILATMRSLDKSRLSSLPDLSEGLENRVYAASRKAGSLPELYGLIKTKRYPLARIRRIVLSCFLGLDSTLCQGLPPYLRVLGIGRGGAEILQSAKRIAAVPILTRRADAGTLDSRSLRLFNWEEKASDLFALCMPRPVPCGFDSTNGVVVL